MTPEERYEKAVEIVLDHEKYWSDVPGDNGGLTVWGISTKSFPDDVAAMVKMNEDEAKEYAKVFYKREFYNKGYDRIKWDELAIKAFDLSVTTGTSTVNKALQKSCNMILNRWDNKIDGILGPNSLNIINSTPPRTLYKIFLGEMEKYYKSLDQQFEKGWLARLNEGISLDVA